MRFLCYMLGDDSESTPSLTQEQAAEMWKVSEEAKKAGVLLVNGGLAPSADGTKITAKDGETSVTDGPFAEAKELIGGWMLMEVRDKEEAVEWTKRFAGAAGTTELRIRQVYGG